MEAASRAEGRAEGKPLLFVSYAREDAAEASALVRGIEAAGICQCWWDAALRAGSRYEDEIQEQLERAECVIVLWSAHSVKSTWVRDEAREGIRRNILVPLALDSTPPPLGFRSQHVRPLSRWEPKGPAELAAVLSDVAAVLGTTIPAQVSRHATRSKLPLAVLAITLLILILVLSLRYLAAPKPSLSAGLQYSTRSASATAVSNSVSAAPPAPRQQALPPTTDAHSVKPRPVAVAAVKPLSSATTEEEVAQLKRQREAQEMRRALDAEIDTLSQSRARCSDYSDAVSQQCFDVFDAKIKAKRRARDALPTLPVN